MKVIFLDVDGVLNTTASLRRDGRDSIDASCLEQLKRICDAVPDARIVLSSAWRINPRDEKLITDCLTREGMTVIGKTPILEHCPPRGQEIENWLEMRKIGTHNPVDGFVILDDWDDMLDSQRPFFVRTNEKDGLTPEMADKVISILSEAK